MQYAIVSRIAAATERKREDGKAYGHTDSTKHSLTSTSKYLRTVIVLMVVPVKRGDGKAAIVLMVMPVKRGGRRERGEKQLGHVHSK